MEAIFADVVVPGYSPDADQRRAGVARVIVVIAQVNARLDKKSPDPGGIKVFNIDRLWRNLPRPPFTEEDAELLADRVYEYMWQQSVSGGSFGEATAA